MSRGASSGSPCSIRPSCRATEKLETYVRALWYLDTRARERAVLGMLHDGLCLDEVAERLHVAKKTACRAHLAAKERLKRAIAMSSSARTDLRR